MPIGVIVARYLKTVEAADPAWFHARRACQMLAFLGGVVGWGSGIFSVSKSPGIQYKGHRWFGISLCPGHNSSSRSSLSCHFKSAKGSERTDLFEKNGNTISQDGLNDCDVM